MRPIMHTHTHTHTHTHIYIYIYIYIYIGLSFFLPTFFVRPLNLDFDFWRLRKDLPDKHLPIKYLRKTNNRNENQNKSKNKLILVFVKTRKVISKLDKFKCKYKIKMSLMKNISKIIINNNNNNKIETEELLKLHLSPLKLTIMIYW